MRHATNLGRFFGLFLLYSTLAISQQPPAEGSVQLPGQQAKPLQQNQDTIELRVLYTSRLLGYIRADDDTAVTPSYISNQGKKLDPQSSNERLTCKLDPNAKGKTPSGCFLDSLDEAKQKWPDAFLIGMADNLAPEFGSRYLKKKRSVIVDGETKEEYIPEPKSRLNFTDLAQDGVVRVLEHYDALVPGKEDFYFGAARLRAIAELVPVNASNVAEAATYKVLPPDPNEHPTPGFLSTHPNAKPFDDGHIVLERNVKDRRTAYSIEIKAEELSKHSGEPGWRPQLRVCDPDHNERCSGIAHTPVLATPVNGGTVETYDITDLRAIFESGQRLLMCFDNLSLPPNTEEDYWNKKEKHRFCHAVSVDAPLFSSFPYVITPHKGGKRVVIFAAVGQDVQKLIATYNRTLDLPEKYANYKGRVKSDVAFWNPTSAVRQAYYECELNGDCDGNRDILLLAQMPLANAEQLTDDLKDVKSLRLTIARAEEVSTLFGADMDYRHAGRPVPVVATRGIYIEGRNCEGETQDNHAVLDNPLHYIFLHNKMFDHLRWVPDDGRPLSKQGWCIEVPRPAPGQAALDKVLPSRDHPQKIEQVVADLLRSQFGGDVGLISAHEIYRDRLAECEDQQRKLADDKPSPGSGGARPERLGDSQCPFTAEGVLRVIWEGGHVQKLRLTGKKLREALKANDTALPDRKLTMSGVLASNDKNFYINSRPLDDNAAYTVIAADALVVGDPTYPSLADETFQKVEDLSDKDEKTRAKNAQDSEELGEEITQTLAKVVCDFLPVIIDDCPDATTDRGISGLRNLSPPRHALPASVVQYLGSVIAPLAHDPVPKADGTQQKIQYRPLWFANLLKNNLSYSLTKAHPNDQVVGSEFGGVTDPRVLKAHTESNSVDHDLRAGYSWQHYAVGVEETIQFGRNRQGSTSGNPDSVTLTNNKGTIGPFFEFAIKHNTVPYWRVVLRPLDLSDNFARTIASIVGAKNAAGKPTSFTENLPAQRSLGSKVGMRFEAPQRADSLLASEGASFIELGYKSTYSINLPTELTLNPGSATPVPCSLVDAKRSLATCAKSVVATDGAIIAQFDNNRQNGGYWTGIFRFPIGTRLTYKLQSDGEVRPGGGTSAETHYAVTVDNFLQTRLWGNFGLAPHIGWFFYENQVDHNDLIRHTIDVTLTYNFNWHQGLSWRAFFNRPGVGH